MKRILLLLLLGLSVLLVNAQKENGTVYSDHESIAKTKALWAAFLKGDRETYINFFSDSVVSITNGIRSKKPRADLGASIEWWKGVENLSIRDDTPAFPDAIQYKEGGLWVQDWLRISGTHQKTGINIDLPAHNLYRFDKAGKINLLSQYYSNNVFQEISNSQKTIENGTVYINHPYIITVRKLINALCAKNMLAWSEFFDPKATFFNIMMKTDKVNDFSTQKKEIETIFSNHKSITMNQQGYPDCIYYSKEDYYVVYSWWIVSYETSGGKKKSNVPMMYSHTFNKEGKITSEMCYLNSNHFN